MREALKRSYPDLVAGTVITYGCAGEHPRDASIQRPLGRRRTSPAPGRTEEKFADNLEDLNGNASGPGPGAGTGDFDGDGLTDLDEYEETKTDPTKADTDDDGLSDGVETNTGTYVSATNKSKRVKPIVAPEINEKVFLKPLFKPEVTIIAFTGPGEIDNTIQNESMDIKKDILIKIPKFKFREVYNK